MDSGARSQDFRSAYRHGFARVAACTLPVSAADPARNAEAILEQVGLTAQALARSIVEDVTALDSGHSLVDID